MYLLTFLLMICFFAYITYIQQEIWHLRRKSRAGLDLSIRNWLDHETLPEWSHMIGEVERNIIRSEMCKDVNV